MGTYYQFNTASAGTGGSGIINTGTTSSICPKGWLLPQTNQASYGYYGQLLKSYGIVNSTEGVGDDGQTYNINAAPLYFVKSGILRLDYGNLSGPARIGYLWSSSTGTAGSGFWMQFNANTLNLAVSFSRAVGAPVRCVAR